MGTVSSLYHYPIKGLSPQPLQRALLSRGCGFPADRIYGLARAESGFDPLHPRPMSKGNFFMLRRDERLAGLQTHLEPGTRRLTIHVQGRLVHESDLSAPEGAAACAQFFATLFDLPPDAQPIVAHAEPHRFTDVSVTSAQMMNAVSLINLASVEDLARRVGKPVNPLRFRANLYFDGWPAFSEFDHIDREIRIGEVRMRILKRTQRCAATEVNPTTAMRDLPVPRLLHQHYGHVDMGIYAEVLSDGTIAPGDLIKL